MKEDHGLSEEAVLCLAMWFSRRNNELRSHEPHANLNKHRAGMNELREKGFVTEEPFNKYGSIIFRSTDKADGIGWKAQQQQFRKLFATHNEGSAT